MGVFKLITKAQVLGIVRHAITTAAGIAIANGYIDSESAVQLTGWLVAGIGVVWSIVDKKTKDTEEGP